jgi:Zn-dependent peptidase ImmA (M78 family)
MWSASDVLNHYWDGHLPVEPAAIASKMGVEVRPELWLEGGVSGMVQFNESLKPVISYDQTEAPVRQRFTIAHELGHLVRGHLTNEQRMLRDPKANFFSQQADPRETEANGFAADLLMPAHIVRFAVLEKGVTDLVRLANLFNVSQAAMRFRLINLGLA